MVSDLAAAYDSGAKLLHKALEVARSELGRQERSITPVDLAANEIYDILRKRLFKSTARTNVKDRPRCLTVTLTIKSPLKRTRRAADVARVEFARATATSG